MGVTKVFIVSIWYRAVPLLFVPFVCLWRDWLLSWSVWKLWFLVPWTARQESNDETAKLKRQTKNQSADVARCAAALAIQVEFTKIYNFEYFLLVRLNKLSNKDFGKKMEKVIERENAFKVFSNVRRHDGHKVIAVSEKWWLEHAIREQCGKCCGLHVTLVFRVEEVNGNVLYIFCRLAYFHAILLPAFLCVYMIDTESCENSCACQFGLGAAQSRCQSKLCIAMLIISLKISKYLSNYIYINRVHTHVLF